MRRYPRYNPAGVDRARRLRREATFPERLLWSRLRGCATGVRFRRQRPVGGYIVDFYCPDARLVVEVDGRSHEGRRVYDARREAALRAVGLEVLRVTNDQVLADVDTIAAGIAEAARERMAGIARSTTDEGAA